MVKNIFMVSLLSLACGLVMGSNSCDKNQSTKTVVDAKIVADLSCKVDADCTMVKADCCGCNQGGKQQVIARTAEKKHNDALKATCKEIMCPQVISTDPSCEKAAQCHQGKCN